MISQSNYYEVTVQLLHLCLHLVTLSCCHISLLLPVTQWQQCEVGRLWRMFLKQSSICKRLCHKNTSIQCFKRSIFRQLVLSELGVRHAGPIPGIPMCVNLKYKRECCCWLRHPNTYKSKKKKRIYPFIQLLTRAAATHRATCVCLLYRSVASFSF